MYDILRAIERLKTILRAFLNLSVCNFLPADYPLPKLMTLWMSENTAVDKKIKKPRLKCN
jgi:hypothetical protein